MNKATHVFKIIVECMWFALFVLCVFITAREAFRHNTSQAMMFAALSLAALFFFFFRRHQRKIYEKEL